MKINFSGNKLFGLSLSAVALIGGFASVSSAYAQETGAFGSGFQGFRQEGVNYGNGNALGQSNDQILKGEIKAGGNSGAFGSFGQVGDQTGINLGNENILQQLGGQKGSYNINSEGFNFPLPHLNQ